MTANPYFRRSGEVVRSLAAIRNLDTRGFQMVRPIFIPSPVEDVVKDGCPDAESNQRPKNGN